VIQDEADHQARQRLARRLGKIDPSRRSGCAARTDWREQVDLAWLAAKIV
jgi:hypothetical protein